MGALGRPGGGPALGWPRTRRLALGVALALLVCLPAVAQAPATPQPGAAADALRRFLDPAAGVLVPRAENETGNDLHSEDIRIAAHLDVRNVDYQVLGILFGGGKVSADVVADLRVEFRAVGVARLDEALRQASGDRNVTLNGTFGVPSGRLALGAEEIRAAGAGALLQAFQATQGDATRRYLEATVPGLAVLSADFTWANVDPTHLARDVAGRPLSLPRDADAAARAATPPDLREPPIVLEGHVRMQYLDRVSLLQALGKAASDRPEKPSDRLKDELTARQRDHFLQRNAFDLAGFSQLLSFQVPPGWRVALAMTVPRGFTIEGHTDELVASSDRRSATYVLDGSERSSPASEAALATLSNRFLVTVTAFAVLGLLGLALRLPVEATALALARRRDRRPPQSRAKV